DPAGAIDLLAYAPGLYNAVRATTRTFGGMLQGRRGTAAVADFLGGRDIRAPRTVQNPRQFNSDVAGLVEERLGDRAPEPRVSASAPERRGRSHRGSATGSPRQVEPGDAPIEIVRRDDPSNGPRRTP
ncbi:MAG: hypothetical protein ACRDTD_32740, partial [Pseudonocardiaceae bacterium]